MIVVLLIKIKLYFSVLFLLLHRMWDFDKDEICVLKSNSDTKTDLFTCIEYNAMKGVK